MPLTYLWGTSAANFPVIIEKVINICNSLKSCLSLQHHKMIRQLSFNSNYDKKTLFISHDFRHAVSASDTH